MEKTATDIVTMADIILEIGNIERFPNAKELAKFAGIASVNSFSCGKRKRRVHETGKTAFISHLLLLGNPDGAGILKKSLMKSAIP